VVVYLLKYFLTSEINREKRGKEKGWREEKEVKDEKRTENEKERERRARNEKWSSRCLITSDYILLYFTTKLLIFLSMCMKNKCTGNFITRNNNLMLIYFAHKLLKQIINKL